ncbi:MAG: hypothetical protein JNK37_23875 [Verrucomicrobiales bacterium]|nr:hypothetical protein [Verrucomicrobiales bacterium]
MSESPAALPVSGRIHLPGLPACPFLPAVTEPIPAAAMKAFRNGDRGGDFYLQALKCAQSLWLQGFPAQALLQINRALGADLQGGEPVLGDWPLPYRAAVWVMRRREADQFIGNPRRHYQHLATRMVEPRKTQRAWRAWACWYLACRIFPDCPADEKQLAEEGIVEPDRAAIVAGLAVHGLADEVAGWELAEALALPPDLTGL